jgi:hypothetical protein
MNMAELSYNCSVSQGFNFKKDEQILVGHIVSCKVGSDQFDADLNVSDPEDAAKLIKVFGIVSSIFWSGGYADPVQFSCQVSNANKTKIATLTHKSLSNTEVLFKFNIYDYDPKEKKYYKCFHSNAADMKGLVLKSGGELVMAIDMDQSMEIVSPKNFSFSLGVMPQDLNMEIHIAVSLSDKFVKKWGVEVAK